jgi:hypothetical protein
MGDNFYDPKEEAQFLGLKVNFLKLKRLNSFILEKVIYLRENMNKIEERCSLTYEVVRYVWNKYSYLEQRGWHSRSVENILKQQTARKLVCPSRFDELYQDKVSFDEMEKELQVTKEYLLHYVNYCKTVSLVDDTSLMREIASLVLK